MNIFPGATSSTKSLGPRTSMHSMRNQTRYEEEFYRVNCDLFAVVNLVYIVSVIVEVLCKIVGNCSLTALAYSKKTHPTSLLLSCQRYFHYMLERGFVQKICGNFWKRLICIPNVQSLVTNLLDGEADA